MNRLDVVKEGTHSHPPIEEDLDVNQDEMDEDSAKEEESESSSSEETSVEESEDERAGEWVPWQEDEGTNEVKTQRMSRRQVKMRRTMWTDTICYMIKYDITRVSCAPFGSPPPR